MLLLLAMAFSTMQTAAPLPLTSSTGARWREALPIDTGAVVASAGTIARPAGVVALPAPDTGAVMRRPRAIEYPEGYGTRLTIHRIGAYAMLPLFGAEYVLGQRLITSTNRPQGLKTAHSIVAGSLGAVFVSNTVTGVWNFWDARHDPNDRARRTIHSIIMLASDAGMVWAGASAGGAKRTVDQANRHRAIALGSMGLSVAGAAMMWIWKK